MENDLFSINQIRAAVENAVINNSKSNRGTKDISIHASELVTFCSRKYKLLDGQIHDKERRIPIGIATTFLIGRAVEDFVISSMNTSSVISTLFKYECSKCGNEYLLNRHTHQVMCPNCNDMPMMRKQVTLSYLIAKGIYLQGNPDLIMQMNSIDKNFYIYEIKSIKPEAYELLESPLLAHSYQLQAYLWLAKQLSLKIRKEYKIQFKYGYVLYIKKTYAKSPIKIFKVLLGNKMNNLMKDIISDLDNSKLPDRICSSKDSLLAKRCPVATRCFNA